MGEIDDYRQIVPNDQTKPAGRSFCLHDTERGPFGSPPTPTSGADIRTYRAAYGQPKSIAIFGYKQSLLSVDMKTKVVQHVESE